MKGSLRYLLASFLKPSTLLTPKTHKMVKKLTKMCLSDPIGNGTVRRDDVLSICLGRSTQFQEAIFQYSSSVSSTSERGAVAIGILSLTSTMAGVTTTIKIVLLLKVRKEVPLFYEVPGKCSYFQDSFP